MALCVTTFAQPANVDEKTAVQIEALNRLKGADLEGNAALKAAVLRILEKTRGTPQFVEIVRVFNLKGHGSALLEYAMKYPSETSGIGAFRLALAEESLSIPNLLDSTNAVAVVKLIANTQDKDLQQHLRSLTQDTAKPLAARQAAVQMLARNEQGAAFL